MCRFLDAKHLVNWFVKKTHLFTFSKLQIFHKGSCSAVLPSLPPAIERAAIAT